jgi:PKD repeat protein
VASFTHNCTELSCTFDASGSSDSDGSIVSYSWDFGDGNSATGMTTTHNYAVAGSYAVALTVTDDTGDSKTSIESVNVTSSNGDSTAPVISGVTATSAKGTRFVIEWVTDEPSTSVVIFTCCGEYSDSALVTSHRKSFRGSNGVLYEYWVSSTDAAGNTATAGPYYHQN